MSKGLYGYSMTGSKIKGCSSDIIIDIIIGFKENKEVMLQTVGRTDKHAWIDYPADANSEYIIYILYGFGDVGNFWSKLFDILHGFKYCDLLPLLIPFKSLQIIQNESLLLLLTSTASLVIRTSL